MTNENKKQFDASLPWFVNQVNPDFVPTVQYTHHDYYIDTVIKAQDEVEYQKYLDLLPVLETLQVEAANI